MEDDDKWRIVTALGLEPSKSLDDEFYIEGWVPVDIGASKTDADRVWRRKTDDVSLAVEENRRGRFDIVIYSEPPQQGGQFVDKVSEADTIAHATSLAEDIMKSDERNLL